MAGYKFMGMPCAAQNACQFEQKTARSRSPVASSENLGGLTMSTMRAAMPPQPARPRLILPELGSVTASFCRFQISKERSHRCLGLDGVVPTLDPLRFRKVYRSYGCLIGMLRKRGRGQLPSPRFVRLGSSCLIAGALGRNAPGRLLLYRAFLSKTWTTIVSAHATECSCRDSIPANSSANGTCKTQNGSTAERKPPLRSLEVPQLRNCDESAG